MPKFKSIVVAAEKRNRDGIVVSAGQAVCIPLDDAAMLEPVCDTALEKGLIENPVTGKPYTREEFDAKKIEIKAMFLAREKEANKRRPSM